MNVAKVWETLGDRRGEVVEKVLQCQTAEELLELAATYGVELTDSQAEKYWMQSRHGHGSSPRASWKQ